MRSLFTAARELQSGASVTSTATQTPPLSPSLSLRQSSSSPFARPAQSDKGRPKISLGCKRPHKSLLQHSASFPVTAGPAHSPGSLFERIRLAQSHRRPLPLTPPQQRSRLQRASVHQCRGPGDTAHTRGHEEEVTRRPRRETVHWFPLVRGLDSDTEHIYEEIHETETSDEELAKDEASPHSFLALISLERRRHLKFYGRTDWDYGSDRY